MKKVSLDQKIAYCQQYGTLKTLSLNEAIVNYTKIFVPADMKEQIAYLTDKYANGKYLCYFYVNAEFDERFEIVCQISTLGNFVRNIVYFMLTK